MLREHARPGQGDRQDRRLRPRRQRPDRQEPRGRSGPAASAWCSPTPRPTRSTPTSTSCRPCTSTRSPARRSRRTCRHRQPDRVAVSAGVQQFGVKAPQVAAFSSRGPALAGGGDLLKPDIIAPGVDIIAGVSPDGHDGRLYDFISGTSMSSPHIAGIAALLIQKHPAWSPMAVKSALMTTRQPEGQQGRGRSPPTRARRPTRSTTARATSTPNPADDPGPGLRQHRGRLGPLPVRGRRSCRRPAARARCSAATTRATSTSRTSRSARWPARQTVTRTVTNVTRPPRRPTCLVQEPRRRRRHRDVRRGCGLQPGGKASYRVTFTRTSAAFDEYAFGSLTWTDGLFKVRSQLAVKPVPAAAPAEVDGHRHLGLRRDHVTPGFTGTLTTSVAGLIPSHVRTTSLSGDRAGLRPGRAGGQRRRRRSTRSRSRRAPCSPGTPPSTPTSRPARTSTSSSTRPAPATWWPAAPAATAEEEINIPNPPAGTYDLYVDLFGATPGQRSTVPAHIWTLDGTARAT